MKSTEVAKKFVDAINKRSPDLIAKFMTEKHRFVDSLGAEFCGRDNMREGWKIYFAMVPDYTIEISKILSDGKTVSLVGRAFGTVAKDGKLPRKNKWEAPAAWLAKIEGGKVSEWRVFCDNEPVRKLMG